MTIRERKPLFERLQQGLEEGIAHAQGELTLRTVPVPEEPPEIDAKTLAALRAQTAMSQAVFAKMLNVSTKTLQSWEQGLRRPSHASRRLIQVFSEHPAAVCRSAGLPVITLEGVEVERLPKGRRRIVVRGKPTKGTKTRR
jgi:putative transcriptional regulator